MSLTRVLGPMGIVHCPHTGLTIPECSCRECCRVLVHRYAPKLLEARQTGLNLQAPIIPLQRYAQGVGLSVDRLKEEAARREVLV
jgi:hypothetical protein